jgi:hypothetical protein
MRTEAILKGGVVKPPVLGLCVYCGCMVAFVGWIYRSCSGDVLHVRNTGQNYGTNIPHCNWIRRIVTRHNVWWRHFLGIKLHSGTRTYSWFFWLASTYRSDIKVFANSDVLKWYVGIDILSSRLHAQRNWCLYSFDLGWRFSEAWWHSVDFCLMKIKAAKYIA